MNHSFSNYSKKVYLVIFSNTLYIDVWNDQLNKIAKFHKVRDFGYKFKNDL